MNRLLIVMLISGFFAPYTQAAERVVSVGGSVTEIIYALNQQHRLIARDTTSSFPPEVEDLPDVGYMRALSPEGVLSMQPDLVLAEDGSGPPETIEVLENARVPFISIPEGYDTAAIRAKIESVAAALEVDALGQELADRVDRELDAAVAAARTDEPARVLFILSMQGGRILASGTETAADGIIRLAGAQNAMLDFTGYKPLTDEAAISTEADVILMMDRGGDHSADDDALFAHPGLAATPAGQRRAVVRIDGLLLLGFGPRTPTAVRQLTEALDSFDTAP